jgi:outer membrane protein TolC
MRSASISRPLLALLLVWQTSESHGQTNAVERSLSLSQCFRIAVDHNLDVKIARFNPEIQQHNLSASYGAYEPASAFAATRGFSAAPVTLNALGEPVTGPASYGDSFTPGITGILPGGMSYNLGGNLEGISQTGPLSTTRDATASTSLQLTQPLLRNAWIDSPRATIQINKKLLKISKLALTQQIMTTLTSVELAYYNLIVAQDQVEVYEQASQLAQRLVNESKLRVAAGSLASLDEKQAESLLSSSQSDLFGAQGALVTQEYALKNLLSDKLSEWDGIRIKPAEELIVVPHDFDLNLSWKRGLSERPDLLQARANIERQGIVLKYLRNQIYPELDLVGSYAFTGAGTTYSDALDGVRTGNSPSWTFGAQLSLPLEGNRSARETYRSNKAQKEQLVVQLKQLEQNIMVQIAVSVEQARTLFAQVDATRQSRLFAEAALEAEQKKLDNGRSTSFVVVQLQRDLTTARLAELASVSQYNQALVQLAFNEGSTLERDNLNLEFR